MGHSLIGYAYLQTLQISINNFISLKKCTTWEKILKFFTQNIKYHIAYCGSFFKDNMVGYYCHNNAELKHLFLGINQFTKINLKNINVGLLGITNVQKQQQPPQFFEGFLHNNNDFGMALTLNNTWVNFNDYLNAITKKYRARILKLYANNTYTQKPLTVEALTQYQPQIQQLYTNILTDKNLHIGQVNSQYFLAYKIAYPNNFECIGYFNAANNLEAFATYITEGNNLNIHYIGLNKTNPKSSSLYHLILTDGLKKAIHQKMETLYLGRTAYEAKAILGGKPVQINTLYSAKNKWLQKVSSYILNKYNKENNIVLGNRNPFKA